jgi:trans-aconitate 2-methyltransferase
MPTWNPDQYLKFAEERTRPCHDLAARIAVANVRRVIDLGCGPGNSTRLLSARWPEAEITGLDNSAEMIATARREQPGLCWETGEIASWAAGGGEPYDVVFSNAALQWVGNHATLYPQLLSHVAAGGALAVQVPGNFHAAPHRLMRELAASAHWRPCFPDGRVREWYTHEPEFYYDVLTERAERLDLWVTEYVHVLPNVAAIVEFYKGTGLRPFLDALGDEQDRARFLSEYLTALEGSFAPQADGKVLFPFRRIFLVAYV